MPVDYPSLAKKKGSGLFVSEVSTGPWGKQRVLTPFSLRIVHPVENQDIGG